MVGTEVAAFDVDGTLTRRDCVLPFLVRVAGRAKVAGAFVRHAGLLAATLVERERRDDVKAALTGLLAGRPLAEMSGAGESFASEIERRWVRPDVARRLAWHRDAGHEVVLVTASYAVYAEPLGQRLGAARVIATELEVGADGALTGRLAGPNCRGAEKVRRLAALYGEPPALAWAYGDSRDDQPMLATSRHPVRVGRDPLAAVPS